MLRGTRPIWASSVRALAMPKASSPALRSISLQAAKTPSPMLSRKLLQSSLTPLMPKTRFATKDSPPRQPVGIDHDAEKKAGAHKLEANPDPGAVSSESTVRHVIEPDAKGKVNFGSSSGVVESSISDELKTVKDTFNLGSVPYESYVLGLAGTVPYLATSFSTVYLSWVLNSDGPSQSGLVNSMMMTHQAAHDWLLAVEPIQLGYGAIIISFLGAIHWGLEYAEKQPTTSLRRTRFRYGVGLAASVIAWPTLFMPWYFALTTQFAAFTAMYFVDARATTRGWAPPWYSTYRFVLTLIVGGAIMVTLIGRARVGDAAPQLSGMAAKFHQTHGEQPYSEEWEKLESEERVKVKKAKEEEAKRKEEEEAKQKKAAAKEKKGGEAAKDKKSDDAESKGGDEGKDEEEEGAGADKDGQNEDKQDEGSDKDQAGGAKGGKE